MRYVYLVKVKHPGIVGCIPMSIHSTRLGAEKRVDALRAANGGDVVYEIEMYALVK